jgi:hypothetical protein
VNVPSQESEWSCVSGDDFPVFSNDPG